MLYFLNHSQLSFELLLLAEWKNHLWEQFKFSSKCFSLLKNCGGASESEGVSLLSSTKCFQFVGIPTFPLNKKQKIAGEKNVWKIAWYLAWKRSFCTLWNLLKMFIKTKCAGRYFNKTRASLHVQDKWRKNVSVSEMWTVSLAFSCWALNYCDFFSCKHCKAVWYEFPPCKRLIRIYICLSPFDFFFNVILMKKVELYLIQSKQY